MGFWAHIICHSPLLGLGVAWAKSPHLPAKPVFYFSISMSILAIDPAIWLHRACYNFTSLFHFLLPRGLMGWCSCHASPLLHQFFAQGFLGLLSTSLSLLGLVSLHSCYTSPFHYFIPWAFSAHLLIFYIFYFHGLFARFFGFSRPNYHIFTSYYYLGLLAFKPHWVY